MGNLLLIFWEDDKTYSETVLLRRNNPFCGRYNSSCKFSCDPNDGAYK